MNALELIREAKLYRLLPGVGEDDWLEASGVAIQDGRLIVIFDNLSRAAGIDASLAEHDGNGWLGEPDGPTGFEDIVYSEAQRRFYALIEAVPVGDGSHRAEVIEYDHHFARQTSAPLPFALENGNKGFEGLTHLQRDGHEYLLALCEGNHCRGGDEGQQPGNGRIQIFRRVGHGWEHAGQLDIPPAADFRDYAGLDVRDGRVAVLSQASAQLWLGALQPTAWAFVDEGAVYRLPSDERGESSYCNAEGVAWMAPDRVAIASDLRKDGAPRRCAEKDQSIHIFAIPPPDGG